MINQQLEPAVALLRSSGLPPRPTHIENPAREFLFLEQRSVRRYSRNKARPIDSWQHHGGTSRVKMQLPARLQQGESPQVLVRRLGKVVRHDQPELRFHQYEIDDVKVLYHIIGGDRKRGRPPLAADASRKRIARSPTEPVRLRLVPATIPAQGGSAGPVAPVVAPVTFTHQRRYRQWFTTAHNIAICEHCGLRQVRGRTLRVSTIAKCEPGGSDKK